MSTGLALWPFEPLLELEPPGDSARPSPRRDTDLNRCEPAVPLWACSVRVPARLSECGRSWRSRTRSPHSAALVAV